MSLRAFFALAASLGAAGAHACSIPVFRYALDRWPADPYRLEVSAADAQDEGVAKFLRNFTDSTPLNLQPARVPGEGPSRLHFPHAAPHDAPAWSGPLAPALAVLTDSPTRAEIARRILAGENGVWVLVESGQRAADDAAASTLEKRLRYLEQVAQIPAIDPNDPSSKLGPGPALRVGFSLVRVRRDDPAEQPFLKMLAGPKAAGEIASGPWLALVFGRGRALGAWPAEGFGAEQIDEACLFLLGACSCEVKRLNPGWDLLLHTDWHEALHALGFPLPEPSTAAVSAKAEVPEPETVTLTAAAPHAVAPAPGKTNPAAMAAGVLLVLGSALAWRTMRRQP